MTNLQTAWLIAGIAVVVIAIGAEHIMHGEFIEAIKKRRKK